MLIFMNTNAPRFNLFSYGLDPKCEVYPATVACLYGAFMPPTT